MGYDLRRAATAVLACAAVVLAAMLMPAANVGSYVGPVGDPVSSPGPGSGTGPGDDPGDPATDPGGEDPETDPGSTDPGSEDPDSDPGSEDPGSEDPGSEDPQTDPGSEDPGSEDPGSEDPGSEDPDSDPGSEDPQTDPAESGDGFETFLSVVGAILQGILLFVALGGLLVVLGLVVGGLRSGPVKLSSRSDSRAADVLHIFGLRIPLGGLRGLSRGSMRMVLGLARSTGTLLSGIGGAARGVGSALAASGSLLAGMAGALGTVGGGLLTALRGTGGALGSLSSGLGSIAGGLANWRPSFGRGDSPAADARDAGAVPSPERSEDAAPVDPGPQSVEEAWERFVEAVPVSRPEVRTPGEVARTAVKNDWPADPVRRLTHVFREVRYGGAPSTEDRTDGAVGALDRMDGDDAGGDGQ